MEYLKFIELEVHKLNEIIISSKRSSTPTTSNTSDNDLSGLGNLLEMLDDDELKELSIGNDNTKKIKLEEITKTETKTDAKASIKMEMTNEVHVISDDSEDEGIFLNFKVKLSSLEKIK